MDEADIQQTHKAEQKSLNAKIQALKHSVPKGDKKKKKEVAAQIALLTAQLEEKQAKELNSLANNSSSENSCNGIASLSIDGEDEKTASSPSQPTPQPKISKAQKRREKKEAEERARNQRIEEDEIGTSTHSRNIEAALFDKILKERALQIYDINPDGNCMYNAVLVSLHGHPSAEKLKKLREDTSVYMFEHIDDFLPFTLNNTTGDMLSPEEYEQYCQDIKETNSWGGQLELRAISQITCNPIEVYQAHAPTLLIGEEFQAEPIRLSYHHHQYGLGEHYNALVKENDT